MRHNIVVNIYALAHDVQYLIPVLLFMEPSGDPVQSNIPEALGIKSADPLQSVY